MQSTTTEERMYQDPYPAANISEPAYSNDNQQNAPNHSGRFGPGFHPLGSPPVNSMSPVKTAANFSMPAPTSPDSSRRLSAPPNRSGSIGSARDGLGNVDRWSPSTASSRESTLRRRSNSLSRILSFDSFDFGSNSRPGSASYDSPRKGSLPKTNPLPVGGSPRRLSTNAEDSSRPSAALSPITILPSRQRTTDHNEQDPPQSNSTTGLLSAAIHSTVPEYCGRSPEGLSFQGHDLKPSLEARSLNPSPLSAVPPGNDWSAGNTVHPPREDSQGHLRDGSRSGSKSSDITSSDISRNRASKPHSQKAMLSEALQKANTAVVLDNAQDLTSAMDAYVEACDLLQQVLLKSSANEDKSQLEAIRNTYMSRISEIKTIITNNNGGIAIPARPGSEDSINDFSAPEDDDLAAIGSSLTAGLVESNAYTPDSLPLRRESLPDTDPKPPAPHISQEIDRSVWLDHSMHLGVDGQISAPMERQSMMVPPLTPRRPLTPTNGKPDESGEQKQAPLTQQQQFTESTNTKEVPDHHREFSSGSMAWLDTIDESEYSCASSVHSQTSSFKVKRKHIRAASGDTEAEFDAALDAAVEVAYNEGFESTNERVSSQVEQPAASNPDVYEEELADMRRKIELAKERVRESEREAAIQLAKDQSKARLAWELDEHQLRDEDDDPGEDSEEERIFEQITRDYASDSFEFGPQSNSVLPRESDSSGFSGRTRHSSFGSSPTTAGTAMSTIAEASHIPKVPTIPLPAPPPLSLSLMPNTPASPPTQALSAAPTSDNASQSEPPQVPRSDGEADSRRNKRLSNQKPKNLKIETGSKSLQNLEAATSPPPATAPPAIPLKPAEESSPKLATSPLQPPPPLPHAASSSSLPYTASNSSLSGRLRQGSSSISPSEITSSPVATSSSGHEGGSNVPRTSSPAFAQPKAGLKQNFSSTSLKNLKVRGPSVSHIDDTESPYAPAASQYGRDAKTPAMPVLPTPLATTFRDRINGATPSEGGFYLFDNDAHSEGPGSPNAHNPSAPAPLEPCPHESMSRPFWLMRALYQTLVHSRGGYLSTKLFIPRDVWLMRGVKIKAIEEKVAVCDLLTTSLQKLSHVDNLDADATLEEIQAFEEMLENARVILARKLGHDVGVQGSGMLFRETAPAADADGNAGTPKPPSMPSKSSSFSWRRLRSKSSGMTLNGHGAKAPVPEVQREPVSINTVPMASLTSARPAKRDISQAEFTGPHATYRCALARLFDAAQVLDQIAHQVEDPGLKHADKTQVGLELSMRHAAEFFGFYVCRFVLADVGMMLDKYIKRGSEWVLA